MSLQIMEGWDWLAGFPLADSLTQINRMGWSPVSGNGGTPPTQTKTGRFSSGLAVGNLGSGGIGKLVRNIPSQPQEAIVGFAIMNSNENTTDLGPFVGFGRQGLDLGATDLPFMGLRFCGLGIIEIIGVGGNIWLRSPVNTYTFDTWNYVQFRQRFDGAASQTEVRFNGKTLWNLANYAPWGTSLYPDGGIVSNLMVGNTGTSGYSIDDIYVVDRAGSRNNDFLGNVRVKSSFTAADGDHIDSTIGGTAPAATHWQSVQDVKGDDAQYVFSPTIGAYDLYKMQANIDDARVFGVQGSIYSRQDDATQMAIAGLFSSGGTIAQAATDNSSQDYRGVRWLDETDPATSTDWTGSGANAVQVGYKIVTPNG